ncbi:MAG TPA: dihydrodipicolinate reductase C-terminal domain-containing protein [Terriglobales bacterium]|nr:dihydrodipicolinate reductase C-terminal domain-containing protein [Terriglobales bacterium]
MNLVVLGKGKTGSLVAEVARERGHQVRALGAADNANAFALTKDGLRGVDVVIDFTTPQAVVQNIEACAKAGASMVVGTTGWSAELPRVKELVERSGIGFLYAPNFSVGVNVLFEIARAAGAALRHGYAGHIVERHHEQKKDKPSGTAAKMKQIMDQAGGTNLEITSIREGDVVGTHVILLDSANDTMMITHDAKSRRGFAEGAVQAAEWLAGKKGFFEFKDVLTTGSSK